MGWARRRTVATMMVMVMVMVMMMGVVVQATAVQQCCAAVEDVKEPDEFVYAYQAPLYKAGDPRIHNVVLEVYVMSKCGDAVQFVNQALRPVLERVGDLVDLNINYVANVTDEGFVSKHGALEVQGDMQQLCVMSVAPDKAFDFIVCCNDDYKLIPEVGEDCARALEIDLHDVNHCMKGHLGPKLLRASIANTHARGATWSPTIYLNGQMICRWNETPCYTPNPQALLQFICNAYQGPRPELCTSPLF